MEEKSIMETEKPLASHHDRLQNWYKLDEVTWSSAEQIGAGIWVYRDVLPVEMNIINDLESIVGNPNNEYQWSPATVGYGESMPDYRDCYDFKYKTVPNDPNTSEGNLALQRMYDPVAHRQLQAVKDYCRRYNIGEMRFWEATNFIKYGPGQHFQEHHDHGFSYNCTVSLVAYPNDDYEGGELEFRLQGLKVKPRAGDVYIFPSNFMYPHRACPVTSGTKYSLVTMLDYSDKYHSQKFFEETGS
jgi:2OG-Fe(II) oxygenase superfamily